MNILKKILLFAVGLLALLAVIGLLLPAQSRISRSVLIDAPAETVFPLVNNFREFNRWSPWAERDPETQYRFEGPESGVGAKLYWDSEQLRAGSQEIVESEPDKRVATVLNFGDEGGEQGSAQAAFVLEPRGRGVNVTWTFEAEHGRNPLNRYMGVMMNAWVAADYEDGLANLKALAESMPIVVTEEIDYAVDGKPFKGFLAYSRNAGKRPGVLVVHEWWGHNDYVRDRARQLAELGYTAFALDMYGEGKTAGHPQQAQEMMMEVVN
ncbi:MAG TPA: SRPBCC family protein, partial [Gammaproteobacteria bacterium]